MTLTPNPLDDELRLALRSRADALPPLADPFAGVARRARGMRRRRAAAAVAGSALAVLAVVGAGTLLTPDRAAGPSDVAAPTERRASQGLDPANPWPYRGDLPLASVAVSAIGSWEARHPGTTSVDLLFGHRYGASGQPEVVVVARSATGTSWGVLTGNATGGWEVAYAHDLLGTDQVALVAPLPGDGTPRLLVVAAPGATDLAYRDGTAASGADRGRPLARLADGVGMLTYPGDRDRDDVMVRLPGTDTYVEVPDQAAVAPDAPANVLDWPTRGTVTPQTLLDARRSYADTRRATLEQVRQKVLVTGEDGLDGGRAHLLGQFWLEGDTTADTFGIVVRGGDSIEPQLKTVLQPEADLAVMVLTGDGQGGSRLVVATRPGVVAVAYRQSSTSTPERQEVRDPQSVTTLYRPLEAERPGAPEDTLTVSFADGSSRSYPVASLLCGKTSCG